MQPKNAIPNFYNNTDATDKWKLAKANYYNFMIFFQIEVEHEYTGASCK